jgi:hypothetical protein
MKRLNINNLDFHWFSLFIVALIVAVLSFLRNFSLIPVFGLLSCFYLMAQESHTNWYRFLIWLGIGLVVYFAYGYKHSRLAKAPANVQLPDNSL